MPELVALSRDLALSLVPDTPATVEFRHMAEGDEPCVYRSGGGLLLANSEGKTLGAMGDVVSDDVRQLIAEHKFDGDVVADEAAFAVLRQHYAFERAIIQTLAGPWQRPRSFVPGLVIRPLAATDLLDGLPEELREEIAFACRDTRILAAVVEGQLVSFSYVVQSTLHADMSIDTVEQYRNRGIATAVAGAMLEEVAESGKTPVWGALDSNLASLRLAEKLGFRRAAGVLYVAEDV
jgi:RimJ/RimL family protein N-acetyltransferase